MDRVLCIILCLALIVISIYVLARCGELPDYVKAETEVTTQETIEPIVTEPPETEPLETAPVETEPEVLFFDVPLDEDLQLHIIEEATEHGINPAIIIAMAYRESRYKANAVGDNGRSYGLLQIQKKWHSKRMKRLGCTDLLDPYQNVTVGIDYLTEQIERYGGDIAKGLTAYNRGHYAGTITKYAKSILAHAEKLNNERGQ